MRRVLQTTTRGVFALPATSRWQWTLFLELAWARKTKRGCWRWEDWEKGENGGVGIFPARTCCLGTLSLGGCLRPVGGRRLCVCMRVCVCVCVCARGDKVALWKGLWEDRASVSPLMQRQGRMTHNRTLNRCGEEKHSDKHTQAQSSPPWGGLIMAGQGVEGGRGQRGRVEKTEEKRE